MAYTDAIRFESRVVLDSSKTGIKQWDFALVFESRVVRFLLSKIYIG